MTDRHDEAREVIRQLGMGEHWIAFIKDDVPPHLRQFAIDAFGAYERADLDWLPRR